MWMAFFMFPTAGKTHSAIKLRDRVKDRVSGYGKLFMRSIRRLVDFRTSLAVMKTLSANRFKDRAKVKIRISFVMDIKGR
jgi:hypothetical protein